MVGLRVTGIGVWLRDAADRRAAVDAWYRGEALPTLPLSERTKAVRGAAARALHDAGIRSPSAFESIGIGEERDQAALRVDRWVGTIWEALSDARHVCAQRDVAGVLITEMGASGAGALVVAPQSRAGESGYATVEGLGLWDSDDPRDVASGCRRGMTEAGIEPSSVGYLEVVGDGPPRAKDPVIGGLLDAYRTSRASQCCALSMSVTASGIGSLMVAIKAILALDRRFIPAMPDWSGPEFPDRWDDTPFYAVLRAKPWFAAEATRRAVVHGSPDPSGGRGGHLVLRAIRQTVESDVIAPHPTSEDITPVDVPISRTDYVLVPLRASDREGFKRKLAALEAQLDGVESSDDLHALARWAYASYCDETDRPYVMALVGRGREGMAREIAYAREGLEKVFERGEVWHSPRGSTLTTQPLGGEGDVAFVYPGAFNAYLDLGRDLFYLFPFLHERFGRVVSDIGRSIHDRAVYPRSLMPLTQAERRERQAALLADSPGLIESGTSFAVLLTTILREAFGVHPDAALGYSLGEVSMLWALGVWQDGDRGLRAWRSSPIFKTRLSGPKTLVRERWEIPPHIDDDAIWATYVVKAPVARVRGAVENHPRVEVTLINAPGEVVIGGDPAGCREIITALGVHALPVPYDAVIHASLMDVLRAEFAELYHYSVQAVPETAFYSAADYERLTLNSKSLARSLARMTCAPVDFVRLVDRVYQDGTRVFVEVGPQRTCTRWIDKILEGRPHAAMAIDRKNAPDALSILGVLAGLVSHQVPVDLRLLYREEPAPVIALPEAEPQREQRVPEGGQPVRVPARVAVAADALSETVSQLAYHQTRRDAALHRSFLEVRETGMVDMSALIHTQMSAYKRLLGRTSETRSMQFDEGAVRAFARGAPTRCFGALFKPFEGRRVPRIPNGSFRFLDRVRDVDCPQGEVTVGCTLTGEYEVGSDAWFVHSDGMVPYAVLMEMGMQPCGFLSAYVGSTRDYPDTDFYFRNLDGEGTLLRDVDVRGRGITSRTQLRASTAVGNAIVQTFAFTLSCENREFYTGEATFGYFTAGTLDARAGLDRGERIKPWIERSGSDTGRTIALSYDAMPARLSFLRDVQMVDGGGQFGKGYVHAHLDVSPDAWFFARHFYEDPVMPGSLGVEAMRTALGSGSYTQAGSSGTSLPVLRTPTGVQTRWRYRGQILPDDLRDGASLRLEVHVTERQDDTRWIRTWGEGSLWKGALRIYEVKDLAVEIPRS